MAKSEEKKTKGEILRKAITVSFAVFFFAIFLFIGFVILMARLASRFQGK